MASKSISKAAKGANQKVMARQATNVIFDTAPSLLALRDVGENMEDCPFIGWTIRTCILTLTNKVRLSIADMPIPSDAKIAAAVRRKLRDARATLDIMDKAARMLNMDYDEGMEGSGAIGIAIHSLVDTAGEAIDLAGSLMGVAPYNFAFYEPPERVSA
jgi:hypothetical protein